MTSRLSVSKMNDLMNLTSSANNELSSIVKIVNSLQENINEKIEAQVASYNTIKTTIQDYLNKIEKNIPYDEEVLNTMLNNQNEYLNIINLTTFINDKISLVEQVKDALKINEFTESLINNDKNESKNSKENINEIDIDEDENNNNNNNNNNVSVSKNKKYQINTRRKRNRKGTEDDDESYTLSGRDKSKGNYSVDHDDYDDDEFDEDINQNSNSNIICKRKRRPLFFSNTSVKMDKYKILASNPLLNNPYLCEESSDFNISSIRLDSMDKLPELTKEKEALFPLVINDIQSYSSKYLIEHFDELMHVRTLYYCYFDMQVDPPECHYEYFAFDNKIIQGLNEFKFVKLVLVRKPGGKIQNVILGCANLFTTQISRKDIDGNTLIKGELKVTFDTFQYYFLTGIKGFSHLSQVQIEVYLNRSELFEDYNDVIDKSNIRPEPLRKIAQMGMRLKKLRIIDRKIELLNKNQN